MRSGRKVVCVTKLIGVGQLPSFITLGHRHLEKEKVGGVGNDKTFTVPVDLVLMGLDPLIGGDIEEVVFGYGKT